MRHFYENFCKNMKSILNSLSDIILNSSSIKLFLMRGHLKTSHECCILHLSGKRLVTRFNQVLYPRLEKVREELWRAM